ncbi:hypothetical protein PENSPDRAFT_594542 [Peniophora sp. CONT]|nr:hypothetical protein PENSPDRAFT_594542 [Peniophora sp. CONT]
MDTREEISEHRTTAGRTAFHDPALKTYLQPTAAISSTVGAGDSAPPETGGQPEVASDTNDANVEVRELTFYLWIVSHVPKTTSQTQTRTSSVLGDFSDRMSDLLDYLLAHHWDALIGTTCSCSAADTQPTRTRTVTCHNCRQYTVSCEVCWLNAHKKAPTHWAQVWDPKSEFFVPHDISRLCDENKISASVNLGHGGDPCPHANSTIEFTLVEPNGVHSTRLRLCKCLNAPDRVAQLMRAGFFPATIREPSTAFSFELLKDFHMHHLESKKSAYDYMGAVVRLTDNVFTADISNPYEAFHRVVQVWGVLTARKRSGQALGIDALMPHRPKGSMRVYCPACPQPGFVKLPGSDQVPEELRCVPGRLSLLCLMTWISRHINQMAWTLDGNHHLNKYEKAGRSDPDSVSLWEGDGYIPEDAEYKAKMQHINATRGQQQKIEGDCDYLKAAQKQKFAKFKGLEVTGVVNCQCEHVFVLSSVDMHAGERTCYSDAALASAFFMYVPKGSGVPAEVLRGIENIGSYDMACITTVNLVKRFIDDYPELVPLVTKMRWGIPAVHCPNHKEQCWFEFGTTYLVCWCHFFGETAEHYWAGANQIGNFTRQMNAGHRHDVLNDHHGDWNWKKTIRLPGQLLSDLRDAKELFHSMRAAFLNLSVDFGSERTEEWNRLSRTFQRTDSGFNSVYRHEAKKLPSKDAVYQALMKDELHRAEAALRPIEGPLSVSFIGEGLKIRDAQRKCRQVVQETGRDHMESHAKEISLRRSKLVSRIGKWRRQQLEVMPSIADKLEATASADSESAIEDEVLWLPSDFSLEDRVRLNLTELASQEIYLREGEAYDAIRAIKSVTRQLDVLRRYQRDRARAQEQNSRALSEIHTAENTQDLHIAHYTETRVALIALGFIAEKDPNTQFPPLSRADTFRKATEDGRNVGDSRRPDGDAFIRAGVRAGQSSSGMRLEQPELGEGDKTSTRSSTINTDRQTGKKTKGQGWIWMPMGKGKMTDDDMRAWLEEGDRVQWFRAEAEMLRFKEQLEKREVEFLRVIDSHTKTSKVWQDLARQQERPGNAAYARRQAAMWSNMATDANGKLEKGGYSLLAEGEDIVSRVLSRRAEQDAYMREYLTQAGSDSRNPS